MLAEARIEPAVLRAHVREADQAARRLLARAAHMEKRASRARVGSIERVNLDDRARELRAAAQALLTEVSELSRRVTAA
jgi:hypothetical protein